MCCRVKPFGFSILCCLTAHMKANEDSGKIPEAAEVQHYHNSKQQNGVGKGKSITFGECILVSFNTNKSFSFNGLRFDLVPTSNKHHHPYAIFKTQKHQFTFFSVSPLSISTSCKSNSSLFIKSTISL